MSTTRVWIIISLMAIAMIGLIGIQTYWVNFSMEISEQKLEQNIRSTLSQIAKKLESATNEKEKQELLNERGDSLRLPSQSQLEADDVRRLLGIYDVSSVLSAQEYDKIIEREVKTSQIDLAYDYAIYSKNKNALTIANGFNLYVDDSKGQSTAVVSDLNAEDPLQDFDYRIDIFPSDYGYQATLYFSFLGQNAEIWNDVLPILIGSILLLAIVLYAFGYVLLSFYRQRKLTEMKNDFINNMTHEFKTPIATISLAIDSIESPSIIGNEKKIKRFSKIIKQENSRMLGQVEKVLHAALLDKGDYQLNREDLNIHEILKIAIENISIQIDKKGGSIHSELNAENPVLNVDETHVSNIIYNLLENAMKYSPQAPEIKVTTRDDKNRFYLSISDKGEGIPKNVQKTIFEKFYRVHKGDRHDVKGFGLGLAYVKAIMDAHKGNIELESKVGEGSTFTLIFKRK